MHVSLITYFGALEEELKESIPLPLLPQKKTPRISWIQLTFISVESA